MSKAIGIDLGTTYSCVGVWTNNKAEIIPNESGRRITPSIVSFIDKKEIVGQQAKDLAFKNIKKTIYDSKRLIGRKYGENEVQYDKNYLTYNIVKNNETEGVKIIISESKEEYDPEEISQAILSKMKKMSENYTNEAIKDAVITVPAYFNERQRQATRDAAVAAGLNVLRIINEPTSAAVAFGLQKNNTLKDKNVLIFDLGGGTFDVSILNISNEGIIIIKAIDGDTHLGGEDFDNKLVQYCIDEFQEEKGINVSNNDRAKMRLKIACEKAKHDLSAMQESEIELDGLAEGEDFVIKIDRAKFNDLCDSLFTKCISCVKKALEKSKLKKEDIDDIVLVGGSTRIPKIQEKVKQFFNREKLIKNIAIHPDEAVAIGATYLANVLKGNIKEESLILLDIVGQSIGIENNGKFEIILKHNLSIPISRDKEFSTTKDNQTSINFKIYQGENENVKDNVFLKEYSIDNIEKGKAGEMKFKVIFEMDVNSILKVKAINLKNNKDVQVKFIDKYSMKHEEKMKEMIKTEEERKKNEEKNED
jgi:L1 cell adhesion molecule like protein